MPGGESIVWSRSLPRERLPYCLDVKQLRTASAQALEWHHSSFET
jgi:hypothetical protein